MNDSLSNKGTTTFKSPGRPLSRAFRGHENFKRGHHYMTLKTLHRGAIGHLSIDFFHTLAGSVKWPPGSPVSGGPAIYRHHQYNFPTEIFPHFSHALKISQNLSLHMYLPKYFLGSIYFSNRSWLLIMRAFNSKRKLLTHRASYTVQSNENKSFIVS